jgi:Uma2 family endonuclease
MSTVDRPESKILPPLVPGQRLDRATFHERYDAMSPNTRAELVGGLVYMPSPLSYEHAGPDADLSYWLGHYRRFTRGVRVAANATVQFDDYGEPQPDLQLRIPEELGGQSRIEKGYVVGPPELLVEVSKSSRKYDLGVKKTDYERAGVREYLFVGVDPQEVRWFVHRAGRIEELAVDMDGIVRSAVFPGLWLDTIAFFAEDVERLITTLELGLATPEHLVFVAKLAQARKA